MCSALHILIYTSRLQKQTTDIVYYCPPVSTCNDTIVALQAFDLLLALVEFDTARKNLDKATYASDLQTEAEDETYASQEN